MRLSKFRLPAALVGLALLAGTGTVPAALAQGNRPEVNQTPNSSKPHPQLHRVLIQGQVKYAEKDLALVKTPHKTFLVKIEDRTVFETADGESVKQEPLTTGASVVVEGTESNPLTFSSQAKPMEKIPLSIQKLPQSIRSQLEAQGKNSPVYFLKAHLIERDSNQAAKPTYKSANPLQPQKAANPLLVALSGNLSRLN